MSTFSEDMKERKLFDGWIVGSHEIGKYQFIQTQGKDFDQRYHIYVDGVRVGYSADTLDGAIITAIAYKHDGRNSQAAYYFARMIGMDKEA
jgi:hypothetical protein